MNMENLGAANRGPSRAPLEKDLQMKMDFEESMKKLEADLEEIRGKIKVAYNQLEQGRATKNTLKNAELVAAAEKAEEETLKAIVGLEQEEKKLADVIEGRKRSLQ